jgi:hypothetical protein
MAGLLDSLKKGLTAVGGALDSGLDKIAPKPKAPPVKPVAPANTDLVDTAISGMSKHAQALKDAAKE